jgi:predicted RNase H-like nuclease
MKTAYFGVDSCKGGWILVMVSSGEYHYQFCRDFNLLMQKVETNSRVLVDIPIGLLSRENVLAGVRPCDSAARKILGKKHSSIFNPPCFEALYEKSYQDASRVNHEILGKKLSKQSWNIVPKIQDVNSFLQLNPEWRGKILESHPELSFQFLNNNIQLQYSKKTREGIIERITVLEKYWPFAATIFKEMENDPELRGKANKDDMVDALCLAVLNHYRNDNLSNISDLEPGDKAGHKIGIYL